MDYKKFINKLIICLGILFLSSCASTSNITPTVYDKKTINPENVRLIFNRTNTFFYGGVDTRIEINGNVKQNNDAKIKWSYEHNQKINTNSRGISYMPSTFNFVFFKTNNKVAADVTFPGGTWINIGSVWGTCELKK